MDKLTKAVEWIDSHYGITVHNLTVNAELSTLIEKLQEIQAECIAMGEDMVPDILGIDDEDDSDDEEYRLQDDHEFFEVLKQTGIYKG